ncbi:MAG: hypothetical protein M1379_16830 [Firmicutes bacterium]|nr:hypothetical protein [Bacillota bacterium]
MTEQLFFDTDCISSFLWVKQENILLRLYPGRIVLPQEVYDELSNPSIPHIKGKIAVLRSNGDISTQQILINTEAYRLYHAMAITPPKGEKVIGKGEAAALALAKVYGGIIASNNLKDVRKYIEKYRLKHITTGDILVSALNTGLIDENTGNRIWIDMISKRRLLPAASFSDYLRAI